MRSRHRRQVPVAIDDTDPAIKYSGAWSRVSPSEGQYADTVTGTVEVGASAQYTFTGTRIEVFGQRLPVGRINTTFQLDDGLPINYVKPGAVGLQQHQVLFFQSAELPAGEHTIFITNNGESLLLDFFQVTLSGTPVRPSPSKSLPTPSTTSESQTQSTADIDSASLPSSESSAGSVAGASASATTSAPVDGGETTGSVEGADASATTSAPVDGGDTRGSVAGVGTSATSAPADEGQASGMRSGTLAGVIAGGVVLFLLCVALVLWAIRRRRTKTRARRVSIVSAGPATPPPPPDTPAGDWVMRETVALASSRSNTLVNLMPGYGYHPVSSNTSLLQDAPHTPRSADPLMADTATYPRDVKRAPGASDASSSSVAHESHASHWPAQTTPGSREDDSARPPPHSDLADASHYDGGEETWAVHPPPYSQ
ncbi:hypothetical protein C8Q76DRAFT_112973 [Earliella scabrosa]|nr:hypothetical protein C8Q76DRAFT_112973 [Earliella scabrosa]